MFFLTAKKLITDQMLIKAALLILALTALDDNSLQAKPKANQSLSHNQPSVSSIHQVGPRQYFEQTGEREPKVGGPLVAGGPTFGYGAADLRTVGHGWRWRKGDPGRYIYIQVHNNSRRIWRDLTVITGMYDRRGVFLRNESSRFRTPLSPGQTRDETFGPVGPQDAAYTVIGYKGHL